MSLQKIYSCDLCKENINKPEAARCIYYDSTKQVAAGNNFGCYSLVTNLDASPKHVCIECIKMIKDLKLQ